MGHFDLALVSAHFDAKLWPARCNCWSDAGEKVAWRCGNGIIPTSPAFRFTARMNRHAEIPRTAAMIVAMISFQ